MNKIPKKEQGIKRILNACLYSLDGCKDVFKKEAAFRQEIALWIILNTLLLFISFSVSDKMILFFAHTLLLMIEVINSSIERVVDLSSPGFHKLAKNSKDIASFAVMISIFLIISLWIVFLITYFY
jgi:diacylglycerol kinase (ATP)